MDFHDSATPVAFVNVGDRDRALGFFRDTLGLALRSSDPFGDFLEFGPALVRMTVLPDFKAGQHPVIGWNVDDIAAAVDSLRGRGVEMTIYEGMGQDERGIWTAPGGTAKVAFFADPEGNMLSLAEV